MTQPVCVIPGAGPGLGLALSKRFAAAGYRVAMLSRDQDKLEALAAQVQGAGAYACDVTDVQSIASCIASVRDTLGPIDTLLYNAGNAAFGNFQELDPAQFESAWRVNCLGLYHTARAVVEDMQAAGSGNIIVTGATASLKGGAKFAGFASAKAAQHSLAQSMARQLGPENIHVAISIIDGGIGKPGEAAQTSLDPEDIAETYYQLCCQPRSAWTFQIDLRPFVEKW